MKSSFINNEQPLITVVLPVYNKARFIRGALLSVLNQSYSNLEIIIIDDKSTDDSLDIIEKFSVKDSRVVVVRKSLNQGVSEARNLGIKIAQGDYIAFIDADDIWHLHKIEEQVHFIEQKSNIDFIATSYDMIDDFNNYFSEKSIKSHQILFGELLKENYICCSSVLIKTKVAKANLFVNQYGHEDFVYWLTLLEKGYCGYVWGEKLLSYRVSRFGRSSDKLWAAKERWKIYRCFLKYNFIKSLYYFIQYAWYGIKKYKR